MRLKLELLLAGHHWNFLLMTPDPRQEEESYWPTSL